MKRTRTKLTEAEKRSAESWKREIDLYLRKEGYVTYADRLQDIDFIIADVYRGERIEVAAMFEDRAEMVINPAMVDEDSFASEADREKMMQQLSVLVRHELLHFLLVHSRRFEDYLIKKDPNWRQTFRGYSIYEISNIAADYDLSQAGYDDHDKQVVRNMTRSGKVIGGLILSDQHPEWINLTYEELLDKLIEKRAEEIKKAKELFDQLQQLMDQQNQSVQQDQGGQQDQLGQQGVPSQQGQPGQQGQSDQGGQQGQPGQNDQPGQSGQSGEQGGQSGQSGQAGQQGQSDQSGQGGQQGQSGQGNSSGNGSTGDQDGQSGQSNDSTGNQEQSGGQNGQQGQSGQQDNQGDQDGQVGGDQGQPNKSNLDPKTLDKIDYANAWNEIIDRFDNENFSDDELNQLIAAIRSGKIITI